MYSIRPSCLKKAKSGVGIRFPHTILSFSNLYISTARDLKNVAFPITIEHQPFTVLEFVHSVGSTNTVMDTMTIGSGERLTGWQHFDISRDENGNVKVYFNREFVYEFNEDFPHESEYFAIWFCCEGPALDNVVVRNQVIDIQSDSP